MCNFDREGLTSVSDDGSIILTSTLTHPLVPSTVTFHCKFVGTDDFSGRDIDISLLAKSFSPVDVGIRPHSNPTRFVAVSRMRYFLGYYNCK